MHHRHNASPWYRQAIQGILDAAQIPQMYGPTPSGQTSASIMSSGTHGTVIVMVATTIGRRVVDMQPAPRLADDLARWTAARNQVAAVLEQAGCATPRPTRMGLVVTAPEELGVLADVRLAPVDRGRYTATIDGHPELVATIDGRLEVPTSRGYVLESGGGYLIFDTPEAAAEEFAFDCGFGPQITVTT